MKTTPEVIPGIEEHQSDDDVLKISYVKKVMKSSKNYFEKLFIFIVYLILYSFTIIYRLSIKSTFWFYIPLLLLVKSPNLEDSSNIGKFLSALYQTVWAKWRLILSIITLISFMLSYFNYYDFKDISAPFTSIIAILYFDFSSLEIWKILQLSVAVLTIGIFIYADYIRVPNIMNEIALQKDFNIMTIYYLNIIRNWLSFFYFSSALIFLSFYFKIWEYEYVPKFFKVGINTLMSYIMNTPFGT